MKTIATSTIKHNGQLYTAGQEIEVSEQEARALLAARVIQPLKDIQPIKEEVSELDLDTSTDKQAEKEGIQEVAGLEVHHKMKKEKLRGIALAMGLEVDKTMTGNEIYKAILKAREVEQQEPDLSLEDSQ